MASSQKTILIATGGTGGHVFPGLVLAEALRAKGYRVTWLGTAKGIEAKLVPAAAIPFDELKVTALRGKSHLSWFTAPFRVVRALLQALCILRRRKPDLVIGLGGFVSGPTGLAAYLTRTKLVLHEQNAIAGMTNRYLAHLACKVFSSFPDAFAPSNKIVITGNPVRTAIAALPAPALRFKERQGRLRLLVLGGSLGATYLNQVVPAALAQLKDKNALEVWHQCGPMHQAQAQAAYENSAITYRLAPFIDNMAEAYAWADLVLCRAGATTVTELMAAGVGSLLIPYPHAVDDHQTANSLYLVNSGAAFLLPQAQLTATLLAEKLSEFTLQPERCLQMAVAARALYKADAAAQIIAQCEEMLRDQS